MYDSDPYQCHHSLSLKEIGTAKETYSEITGF